VEKQDKAEMAFKLYDKDKDGYITKAEMTKLSKTLTKDQIDKVYTAMKIPFMDSQKGNSAASVPISTFMCLYSLSDCIVTGSVHIFSCSRILRIGRPIVGTYKSLTDTRSGNGGVGPHSSSSRNICFQFSLLCLCSVEKQQKNL
jgi:hypothetical protein